MGCALILIFVRVKVNEYLNEVAYVLDSRFNSNKSRPLN